MPTVYCNDNDAHAAAWLRNLYPLAKVDDRSIADVRAADVAGFRRVHFFAGIGGWEYALALAGWPAEREVWSGSCPCQPCSAAGRGQGDKDPRHLWPELRRLLAECRPATIFGEQVASKAGRGWLLRVRADLEGLGYAVGAADLCAASAGETAQGWLCRGDQLVHEPVLVGAPHIRQRLFWVAHAGRFRQRAAHLGTRPVEEAERGESRQHPPARGVVGGLGLPAARGDRQKAISSGAGQSEGEGRQRGVGFWSVFDLIPCRDGKARRISAQPGDEPLADGLPAHLVRMRPDGTLEAPTRAKLLKGYGNAIVPDLVALFIRAFLEAEAEIGE